LVTDTFGRELGNWGIGELGNWGIGELGNWGIGELGNWGIGELGNWGIGENILQSKIFYPSTNSPVPQSPSSQNRA